MSPREHKTMRRFSPEHIALYEAHYTTVTPRMRPPRWLPMAEQIATEARATSLLDYGCGPVANLATFFLGLPVINYDPAVPAYADEPGLADVVVCMHVLEHIEPEHVTAVLLHLWSLARKAALVMVSCQPSTKVLPDGSPWHSFIKPPSWWAETFEVLATPGTCEALPVDRPGLEYGCLLRRAYQ